MSIYLYHNRNAYGNAYAYAPNRKLAGQLKCHLANDDCCKNKLSVILYSP